MIQIFAVLAAVTFYVPAWGFRAVSFNVFNRPPHREARFRNVAAVLRQLDGAIVGLQEVGHGWVLPGNALDFIKAAGVPGEVTRFWQETNLGVYKNGIAMVSRYPLAEASYVEFRASDLWDIKGYMTATAETPLGKLHLVNLHMRSTESTKVKAREFAELAAAVKKEAAKGPVLILGDFNWDWRSPEFQVFAKETGARSLYATMAPGRYVTWTPDYDDPCDREVPGEDHQQIDNILTVGSLRVAEGGVRIPLMEPHPSDHCPIFAEIAAGQ